MIIRTITFHHEYNFGAMLQAYALITYLQTLGHDVRAIDYRAPYSPKHDVDFRWVPEKYDFLGLKQLYRILKYPANTLEQKRRDAFESFFKKNIDATDVKYHSILELKNNPPIADLYVAGSDQIWNTKFPNGTDASFYLDFGTPSRKISYAASIATETIDDDKVSFVKGHLSNFDAISVRELSAQSLLKSYGFESCVVVDPVFLLDKTHWEDFCDKEFANERYVLVYDFEPRGTHVSRIAKRLSCLLGSKIYSVGPFRNSSADKSFVDVGPDVFLSLVKNAQCVISNSFHGTAFSMVFGKSFFVIDREDGLNIRMHDLLRRYGLLNRLVNSDSTNELLLEKINYKSIEKLLVQDIEKSKSFLQRQIQLAE